MSFLGQKTKQPAERKDWDVDYANWLTAGDGVSDPNNVQVDITVKTGASTTPLSVDAISVDGTRAKLWLKGGTDGCTYKVTVTTTTDDGRIQQDEFNFKVKDS